MTTPLSSVHFYDKTINANTFYRMPDTIKHPSDDLPAYLLLVDGEQHLATTKEGKQRLLPIVKTATGYELKTPTGRLPIETDSFLFLL